MFLWLKNHNLPGKKKTKHWRWSSPDNPKHRLVCSGSLIRSLRGMLPWSQSPEPASVLGLKAALSVPRPPLSSTPAGRKTDTLQRYSLQYKLLLRLYGKQDHLSLVITQDITFKANKTWDPGWWTGWDRLGRTLGGRRDTYTVHSLPGATHPRLGAEGWLSRDVNQCRLEKHNSLLSPNRGPGVRLLPGYDIIRQRVLYYSQPHRKHVAHPQPPDGVTGDKELSFPPGDEYPHC